MDFDQNNSFSKLSDNNPNVYDDNIEKNNENQNYNLIINKPIAKKHSSSILKSPKKELLEAAEKKILGDINSLIKTRFKNPKIEDDGNQLFFLNLLIPANVNKF